MELFNLLRTSFWNILMILSGGISILYAYFIYKKQRQIKKNGIQTEAKVVRFSKEKSIGSSPSLKIPVFRFEHKSGNASTFYRVKGKSNSSCKIGELTPIYYNPDHPEEEYYLPKKDFLVKYLLLFIGSFFFCLGFLYFIKDLNTFLNFKENGFSDSYFLYLILSIFPITLVLYLIGILRNKKGNKG